VKVRDLIAVIVVVSGRVDNGGRWFGVRELGVCLVLVKWGVEEMRGSRTGWGCEVGGGDLPDVHRRSGGFGGIGSTGCA
jgi:hypothetical protein